jgi:hypothetical protein
MANNFTKTPFASLISSLDDEQGHSATSKSFCQFIGHRFVESPEERPFLHFRIAEKARRMPSNPVLTITERFLGVPPHRFVLSERTFQKFAEAVGEFSSNVDFVCQAVASIVDQWDVDGMSAAYSCIVKAASKDDSLTLKTLSWILLGASASSAEMRRRDGCGAPNHMGAWARPSFSVWTALFKGEISMSYGNAADFCSASSYDGMAADKGQILVKVEHCGDELTTSAHG